MQAGQTATGATLSVVGNFCISLGFQLQRLAHDSRSTPLWCCGCALMILGEGSNFTAYSMAPASLVAPLDAIAIVSNALLSSLIFKERLSRAGIAGAVMAIAGIVAMTLSTAPRAETDEEAAPYGSIASPRAAAFFSAACLASLWVANPLNLSLGLSHQARRAHAFYYCFLCGWMGTLTVIGAKSFTAALRHAVASKSTAIFDDPGICWITYLLLAAIVGSVALQLRYLHIAFHEFGSRLVTSLYYALFAALVIITGMLVFHETPFTHINADLFASGLALTFAGVFAVSHDDISLYIRTDFDHRQWCPMARAATALKKNEEAQTPHYAPTPGNRREENC
jgi:hypothetical protein